MTATAEDFDLAAPPSTPVPNDNDGRAGNNDDNDNGTISPPSSSQDYPSLDLSNAVAPPSPNATDAAAARPVAPFTYLCQSCMMACLGPGNRGLVESVASDCADCCGESAWENGLTVAACCGLLGFVAGGAVLLDEITGG